jgi:hypothetical protein
LTHGLSIFQESSLDGKDTLKLEANVEAAKVIFLSSGKHQ